MIISLNYEALKSDFESLLSRAIFDLNSNVTNKNDIINKLKGRDLEPFVKDFLDAQAKGTVFEGSIELISGQRFPDIVAKKWYGVEVKSTVKDHWKSTGNSVLETTRVEDVERIYMIFAKLASPIAFRYRPYEECLSEVVVTHSPRYLIDMELEAGNTIFDRMRIPYDKLRKQEDVIRPIIQYYKSQLKEGEHLWWINQEQQRPTSIIIQNWNKLSYEDRDTLMTKGMVYFPELFGNNLDKFSRFAAWLVTNQGIVCPNVRDIFTAGGKRDIHKNGIVIKAASRILAKLFEKSEEIRTTLIKTPANILEDFWQTQTSKKNVINKWIDIVDSNLIINSSSEKRKIIKLLKEVIG